MKRSPILDRIERDSTMNEARIFAIDVLALFAILALLALLLGQP